MAGWRRGLLGLVLPLLFPACAAAADGSRARPLVAVVALNDGTEITDFMVPFATLAGADVADVVAVAAEAGPVQMHPAVRVVLDATMDSFDHDHPRGADWVVVPAVHHSDDPRLRAWLQHQASLGAAVVRICHRV